MAVVDAANGAAGGDSVGVTEPLVPLMVKPMMVLMLV